MASQEVAISMVYPIMKTIAHQGYDPEHFAAYASFDNRLLQDVEARISGEELERLMLAAAAYTKDEYFGLHQGQITEFADLGILGYVMMHGRTIEQALEAYRRYNVLLCSGFNLNWEVQGDEARIRMFLQGAGRLTRHCVEDMASSLYRLIGRLSNRKLQLREVRFAHEAPADREPYAGAFGLLPRFGEEENVLCLSREVLAYPILYADARLYGIFEGIAQETLDTWSRGRAFSEQVVRWMHDCMPSHLPTLQQTAASFGTSTRTLQHKLKEEDTSFQDLSVRVRKELAMGYLRRKEYAIGDIAYFLHFSEPSAFQSAFKKWTGLTPGQYRAQAIEEVRKA
ncbi:AraC family transcriptional regulator [Paenibacillus filicis]|uniref:AraC family transcriptional regulator n=1 Tax=Paenibacillus filicis TaxID=669464 RepID=A0ABU9DEW4_9BACL